MDRDMLCIRPPAVTNDAAATRMMHDAANSQHDFHLQSVHVQQPQQLRPRSAARLLQYVNVKTRSLKTVQRVHESRSVITSQAQIRVTKCDAKPL